MTRTRVFLGPSMRRSEAQRLLPAAEFFPPAALGDIYRAVQADCQVLVLIDGYFEHVPSVWHKEILLALSEGVTVYGAASMGALRAAELHPFGMRGVGEIFHRYVAGTLQADDEVAVVHAPAEHDFRPASDPLVNLRWGLELAEDHRLISAQTRRLLIRRAKATFYPERSWRRLLREAADHADERELTRLSTFIAERRPDLKHDDTILALTSCGVDVHDGPGTPGGFERTNAWECLETAMAHE